MRSSIPLFALVVVAAAVALLTSFAGSAPSSVTITQYTTSTSAQGHQNPCWCPDGSQIAFEDRDVDPSNPSLEYALYPSGTVNPMAPAHREGVDYAPSLTRIVYSELDGTWNHLYIRPMIGTEVALTTGTVGPNFAGFYGDWEPTFSPDEQWVAFASSRGDLAYGTFDVWVVKTDGTGFKQISSLGSDAQMWPAWEPSGNGIVFSVNGMLYHATRTGASSWGAPTPMGLTGHHPRFSHDGKFLAFDSGKDIWVMNYATQAKVNLTNDGATVEDYSPTWGKSATNDLIAFSSKGRGGNANTAIYVASGVASLTTPAEQVTLGRVKAKYR
jgi:Tol biopolymer transport system component